MEFLQAFIDAGNTLIWSYLILILALGLGAYFAYRTKFVQFRHLGDMIRLVSGRSWKKGAAKKATTTKDGVSSFQALCIACGGCIGTGNVAGVAVAVLAGGPGAVFWMWVIGLLGAGTSFIENTLAQVYKEKEGNGFRGGPAYYMEKGLGKRWMGVIFAICMILSFGFALAALQANTIVQAFETILPVGKAYMGLVIAAMTAAVVFGGAKRIAKFSEFCVPVMASVYLLSSLAILILNFDKVPLLFTLIFQNAFGIDSVVGGGLGAAILNGIKRGVFSSGAGQGDSPHAAAAAVVAHPAKQGLIQSFAIYIDTILVCTATALVLVLGEAYTGASGLEGVQLVQHSFSGLIGDWASTFIALCMLLFCFTSIIANYYYGESNLAFIMKSTKFRTVFRVLFVLVIYWGCVSGLSIVWDVADLFGGTLAVVNLIALIMLGKLAFPILKDYERQQAAGIEEPVFDIKEFADLKNADCWK